RSDAEPFEIGNLLDQSGKGPRRGNSGGRMTGKAADVQLIDNGVFKRRQRGDVPAPVEGTAQEDATPARRLLVWLDPSTPHGAARQGRGCRIEQNQRRVETMDHSTRSVDAPAITESRREPTDRDMPVIARPIAPRMQGDLGQRVAFLQRID